MFLFIALPRIIMVQSKMAVSPTGSLVTFQIKYSHFPLNHGAMGETVSRHTLNNPRLYGAKQKQLLWVDNLLKTITGSGWKITYPPVN